MLTVADWAYLEYGIENPDDEEVTVRLSLRAADRERAVYDRVLTLGPHARVRARDLVTAAAAESYTLSLFVGDARILRTDVPVRSRDIERLCLLFFLNDDPEAADTKQLEEAGLLREQVTAVSAMAFQAPHHWAGYGQARAVVVLRPAYSTMTALQYAALAEYVHRGGTILFADPRGALDAVRTPLSELLPVDPLRIRLTEDLPSLDAWGEAWWAEAGSGPRAPLADVDGIPFLESVARGDGLTVLSAGEYPVLRWSRCGLGRCGFVALNPCLRQVRASGVVAPLWNHCLCRSQAPFALRGYENSRILPALLAQLTGFRVPSVRSIAGLLGGYVAALCLTLLGGYALRRHVAAWLLAAAVGLAVTVGVFAHALSRARDRAPASAMVLDLRLRTAKRDSGQAVISFFTRGEMHPRVTGQGAGTLFRGLPSAARGLAREPFEAPLLVRREGDRCGLGDITVQALKPRAFACLYAEDREGAAADAVLALGPSGPALEDAVLPADTAGAAARAYLLLPGGVLPLERDGPRITGIGDDAHLLALDPFVDVLREYLVQGHFPCPALVVLRPWEDSGRNLVVGLEGYEQTGYALSVLPVAWRADSGQVTVPGECLAIRPLGPLGRRLTVTGGWEPHILKQEQIVLPMEVLLPPGLHDLKIETVHVETDFSNPGGNVDMIPRLAPLPLKSVSLVADGEENRAWTQAEAGEAVGPGQYRFAGLSGQEVTQATYGGFRVLLAVTQRRPLSSAPDADRLNRWRLLGLRVEVRGELPVDTSRRRF